MIKINHTNIHQICQDYTDFVLKKKRHLNKDNPYIAYVFSEHNFKDIVSCPASNLHNKIALFHKCFPNRDCTAQEWKDFMKYMIGQYDLVQVTVIKSALNLTISIAKQNIRI